MNNNPDNLITVCWACHRILHGDHKLFIPLAKQGIIEQVNAGETMEEVAKGRGISTELVRYIYYLTADK